MSSDDRTSELRVRDVVAWLAVFGFAAVVEALRQTKPQEAQSDA